MSTSCKDKCCGPMGLKVWPVVTTVIAIIMFSIAIWLPAAIENALNKGLEDAVTITAQDKADNTDKYKGWADTSDMSTDPTPVYFKLRLFHITNPVAVLGGDKPALEEKGPYVYRQYTAKHDVTFSTNVYGQATVSYRSRTWYVFDASLSTGSEADTITSLNVPFLSMRDAPFASAWDINPLTNTSFPDYYRLFVTKKASELFFGYTDPMWAGIYASYPFVTTLAKNYQGLVGNQPTAADADPFADTVFVGSDPDQLNLRQYTSIKGQDSLMDRKMVTPPFYTWVTRWSSVQANKIYGTDGSQFARPVREGQNLYVYTSQLYRVIILSNINNYKYTYQGITLLRFTLPTTFLQNQYIFPYNAGYNLGITGMANLTAPMGTEAFASKPHFLDADPSLVAGVTGLSPNRDLHDTWIDVEPLSGATMRAARRLQAVFCIRAQNMTTVIGKNEVWFPGVTTTYVPVYWGEESGEIPANKADAFKKLVYGAQTAIVAFRLSGQIVGAFFAVLTVVLTWYGLARANEDTVQAIPLGTTGGK